MKNRSNIWKESGFPWPGETKISRDNSIDAIYLKCDPKVLTVTYYNCSCISQDLKIGQNNRPQRIPTVLGPF